jgi:hypothetical protein
VWGSGAKLVWFYDEAQHLLQLGKGLFSDTFMQQSNQDGVGSEEYNLFYGASVAIRRMMTLNDEDGHVFLGTNLKLKAEFLATNSPAQGCSECYSTPFNLEVEDVCDYFKTYLSDEAMQDLDPVLMQKLCGRPLFASIFWKRLIVALTGPGPQVALGPIFWRMLLYYAKTSSPTSAQVNKRKVLTDALNATFLMATTEAVERIDRMWSDYSPPTESGGPVCGLMASLFYDIVVNSGRGVHKFPAEVAVAISRGILNCQDSVDKISLDMEPVTKQALLTHGIDRLTRNSDGIVDLVAQRMGAENSDNREALEACFIWYIIRECLKSKAIICL